uniref:Trehalose-6-phosphate phosphatase1 n=1 Tax=Moniliella megachiliensis TaxID=203381 RepID=A0A024F8P4_9BASI|nr:trehalose-6-phosphate phosphatase1 [Moniliella megachiliensis]
MPVDDSTTPTSASAASNKAKHAERSLLSPAVYAEEPPLFPPVPGGASPAASAPLTPSMSRAGDRDQSSSHPDQGHSHVKKPVARRPAPQSSLVPPGFPSLPHPSVPPPSPSLSNVNATEPPFEQASDTLQDQAGSTAAQHAKGTDKQDIGTTGRRSSLDSVGTATDGHTHTSMDERPQFETISQIRASLSELEKAYSSQPSHTPLSGRIIHVSHYIPFVIRSLAEVDYERREQEREEARKNVAAQAAASRARRAAREAEARREAILAEMQAKMSKPGISEADRRESMSQAASRMALNGLDGQDMYALLEENQERAKASAGRRAWMKNAPFDDDDDELDHSVEELKDRFTPVGPRSQSNSQHPSRHSSFGATEGVQPMQAMQPIQPPKNATDTNMATESTMPDTQGQPAIASSDDMANITDQWVLTPRRGHTALNSGVRSLCKTHKQTFIGWPGDIAFAAKSRGDTRTEPSQLTDDEKAEIEKVLGALEDPSQWSSRLAPVPGAPKDSSGTEPVSRIPTPQMNGADPIVPNKDAELKGKVLPDALNQARLQKVFRTAASAAKEERREEYEEEEHLDGHEDYGINYVPVWMDSDIAHGFYEGYCKTVLWPLLHYLLWEDVNPLNGSTWDDSTWDAYYQANQAYADRIAQVYKPGDIVIVHDYHLLLVPKMLRQLCPDAHITLFMHAPFPSSEVFRCLPKRTEILEGMLGADLACFQAFSYSRHFLSSCIRVCGFEASYNAVESQNGQVTSISYNPIGIDAAKIAKDALEPGVNPKIEAFKRMYAGKKIIVGRDKLDVVRGVLQKLQAFKKLLDEYPEWRGKVVLIQVTAPAVHDSPALEREVSELVSQINSEFGTLSFAPVHHYHQIIDRDEYFALLSVADLALVTSVRDGMNTTSMEFVICQEQVGKKSPLVLSEFTGTASRMRTALQVNPWNIWGVANAIHEALLLGPEDKAQRHRHAYDQATLHTSRTWAATLVRQLVYRLHVEETSHFTPALDLQQIQKDWLASDGKVTSRRLILLDYDGTLTPIVRHPDDALPSERLVKTLEKLSSNPHNVIFIISGRDQQFLSRHLGHLTNVGFSAEHGSFYKEPGQPWVNITEDFDYGWKQDIRSIFEYYTEVRSES